MPKFDYDDAGSTVAYLENNRGDVEEQMGQDEYKRFAKDLYDSLRWYAMDIPWWLEEIVEPGTWLDKRGQLTKGD